MNTATRETQPGTALLVPPEEQFWKRYSPRGEAPWSLAGSFTLHALVVGLLLLLGVFLASVFLPSSRSIPVEPVRVAAGNGPRPGFPGPGPGIEPGEPGEDPADPALPDDPAGPDNRPKLAPIVQKRLNQDFDPESKRYVEDHLGGSAKPFAELEQAVRAKLANGIRGGDGGPGKDREGKKGPGAGGSGNGKLRLSPREKKMLRWNMHFRANSGAEYLAQLRGLGAILAIPVGGGNYKIVRDLRAPAKLLDEDLEKIQRIYWFETTPSSIRDLMAALGLKGQPERIVAFMPLKLEKDLERMERRYVENVLGVPFDEDRIADTHFQVVRSGGGYRPETLRVILKKR